MSIPNKSGLRMGRCSSSCSLNYTMLRKLPLVIIILLSLQMKPVVAATDFPLYTNSRWIVNERGGRVKLSCVNWVSHLDVVVAEGLSQQPVDAISKRINSMGFNCVRLTWPTLLATNDSLASLTVRKSFQNLGLHDSITGFQSNNPSIIDLDLIQALQAVVKSLGDNDVMVILDNHLTIPGWCCGSTDGNGFFGDQYFDPDLWTQGLSKMASIFNGVTNVVGMSLRNELRGPKQNVEDWFKYMAKGAEAVHASNSDVLVIVSGLHFDTDLSFLRNQSLNLTFKGKQVFEAHWYGFSDGQAWQSKNPNQVCGQVTASVMEKWGFLVEQGWPLYVGEFGMDLRETNVNDNRYFNCFMAVAAELDLDWALWSLVGSYYFREGVVGMEEYYGVLNWYWSQPRNPSFLQRISALQRPFRGSVIFHLLTGLCVLRTTPRADPSTSLILGPCSDSDFWNYSPRRKTLAIGGTYFCLQVDEGGKPAKLGKTCSSANSSWEMISDSKLHLSSQSSNGSTVCLDVDNNNTIVTNTCYCLSTDATCDPASQWFKYVDTSNRRSTSTLSINSMLSGPERDNSGNH